ncbi:MAG: alpha-amylase, partial [Lachnospiraceae bacterium]|nr:alpha-amylase [Lachnospiraceae bacterium]
VSYDKKHNEENGENNKDGSDYNYSWNCGVEGKSRKKQVLELRKKQIRNAWLMLFLAQGTPMILSGDEFLNSGEGNNNPYCQDNRINWLNWKQAETNKEMVEFVKFLIQTRKNHPILHKEEQFRIMDYISCGYPDLSYHGNMAWYPQFENYNRHLGIMLCGKYAKVKKRRDDDFFYVAYNMHWTEHEFALPKLPSGFKWYILTESEKGEYFTEAQTPSRKQTKIAVPERSILVLIGKRAV